MDPKRSARPAGFPGPPGQASRPAGPPAKPGAAPARPAAPASALRSGPASYTEALDQLDRDVRRLRVDFERFFNGALTVPPEDLRGKIQIQLRNFRNVTLRTAVESFRLSDLEARFNSYNELFNRRLREREEGRHVVPTVPGPERSRFDPRAGIVVGDAVLPDAAEALYAGLCSGPGEAPRFDLASFHGYLSRQAEAIRGRTGCTEVLFRLADEDGKLKLKARPVGPPAAAS